MHNKTHTRLRPEVLTALWRSQATCVVVRNTCNILLLRAPQRSYVTLLSRAPSDVTLSDQIPHCCHKIAVSEELVQRGLHKTGFLYRSNICFKNGPRQDPHPHHAQPSRLLKRTQISNHIQTASCKIQQRFPSFMLSVDSSHFASAFLNPRHPYCCPHNYSHRTSNLLPCLQAR